MGRKLECIALIEAGARMAREHEYNEELLSALTLSGFQKGDTDLQAAHAETIAKASSSRVALAIAGGC